MTAARALVRLVLILIVAVALTSRAEDVISGRWEGTAQIPDNELSVVIDLAQENGAWVGSIIIPLGTIIRIKLIDFILAINETANQHPRRVRTAWHRALSSDFRLAGNPEDDREPEVADSRG